MLLPLPQAAESLGVGKMDRRINIMNEQKSYFLHSTTVNLLSQKPNTRKFNK
jgi:hypothetical protein